jgi:peptide/nickel transport system substrate-binding protein
MRTPRIALALSAALTLAVTGCSAGESVPEAGGGAAGGSGATGECGTLVAAISSEPDQFDAHQTTAYASFQVLENVFDTLVQPDENLEFQPALAESWETSEDQLTWTFTLREGVTWHDGTPFTADDVVYSLNRIIDEDLANAYRFDSVESVTASDDRTVVMKLTRPTPNLLANLGSYKGTAIVQQENVESGQLASDPVGTGPFTFESYTPGQGVTLSAYEDYWGGNVPLDGVEFRFIPEATAALTALRTGDVQWTDNVPPQQIETLAGEDSIELARVASTDYWYVAPNFDRPVTGDPRVRRAIALGIDREAITQAALFGAATPNQTAIPEGRPFAVDYAPYERDVEEARRLVEEARAAGVPVEAPLDLIVTNEFPQTVTAAEVIAGQLAEVGLTVQPRVLSFSQWLAEQSAGNFDLFHLGWLGNIDPEDYYYTQHVTDGANNYQGYSNAVVDEALQTGRTATDDEARAEAYETAVRQIVDDVSYLYLYNPEVVQAYSPELTGYTVRPDRAIRFADACLEG